MEVRGSLGPRGQGHIAANSHPSTACAMAPPSLLKKSEGKNQLKSSPCLSQAPHGQRISICPEKRLQSQPLPLKPPGLARKTGAGASGDSLRGLYAPGRGRSSDVTEQEFSLTQFRSVARQGQTASLSPGHSQKTESQREVGGRVDE